LMASGAGGLILGTATVFFAYEGFELVTYDLGDMDRPERTLRRSLLFSVAIVAVVYMAVTVGAQMLASDQRIIASKETAFIAVGQAALGGVGRWIAIAGAVLATGSAINATLFSAARLLRDASTAGEVPAALGRETHGLPIVALAAISVVGAALAMMPGLTAIIAFGSGTFLAVYTTVNVLQFMMATRARDRIIAAFGAVACVGALGALVVELARDDPRSLLVLIALTSLLTLARVRVRRHALRP
jgi:amino acid transporter